MTQRTDALNRLLTIVYVMLALAIVIALMGIGTTLSLAISERARELGLLQPSARPGPRCGRWCGGSRR